MQEQYLTLKELCATIKYKPQTIYNMICRGTFIRGIHYLKPSPRKLLFKWSAIKQWLGDDGTEVCRDTAEKGTKKSPAKSSINI